MPVKFESQQAADDYHQKRMQLAEELLLDRATKRDFLAVQNILMIVADALLDSARITPKISHFMANALYEINEGRNSDDAFGISKGRGRPRENRRAYLFARRVEDAEGTLEERIASVARKYSLSEETLKGYWKKHHVDAAKWVVFDKERGFAKIE